MAHKVIIQDFQPHPVLALARAAGLTVHHIARHLGLSYSQTWEMLSGRRETPERHVARIEELRQALEAGTVEVVR